MKIQWNIQRFAEAVPVDNNEPGGSGHTMPEPSRHSHIMPSQMAPEAWHNVENMLTTLSANARIQHEATKELVSQALEEIRSTRAEIQSSLQSLSNLMGEFKTLMEEATVEVTAEEAKENEQNKADKKKYDGYLGHRR